MTKKELIKITAVSSIISLIVFVIEGIGAFCFDEMLIYRIIWGGDCATDVGIGWQIFRTYPMSMIDEPVQSIHQISFDFNILLFFVFVWIMAYLFTKFKSHLIKGE